MVWMLIGGADMLANLLTIEKHPQPQGAKTVSLTIKTTPAGRLAVGYVAATLTVDRRAAQALGAALMAAGVQLQDMSREA